MGLTILRSAQVFILAVLFFGLGFIYKHHLPRFEGNLKSLIEQQVAKHAPVKTEIQQVKLTLIPLGVKIVGVDVVPIGDLAKRLAPARVGEIQARLAVWPLIRGEVRLSLLKMSNSTISLFLDEKELLDSDSGTPRLKFEMLDKLPIDELQFDRIDLQGRIAPRNYVFRVNSVHFSIFNRFRSLYLELKTPSIQLKPSGPQRALTADLEIRSLLEERQLRLSALKMRLDDSFVVASGRAEGNPLKFDFHNGTFDARLKINLENVNEWEKALVRSPFLNEFSGELEADSRLVFHARKPDQIMSNLRAQDLAYGKFKIGNVDLVGEFSREELLISELRVQNDAGKAKSNNIQIKLRPQPSLSGTTEADNVDIAQLLLQLGGKRRIPLELKISGKAKCEGPLLPEPKLKCEAEASAPHLRIFKDLKTRKRIVATPALQAKGGFTIGKHEVVVLPSSLKVGAESAGGASGRVQYARGFNFEYYGEKVRFLDVESLADLKLEGELSLKGTTEGNSDSATFAMDLDGKDLWFMDYPLGQAKSRLSYKSGNLKFSGMQGQFNASRYSGDLTIDLPEDRMNVIAQLPFMDLKDLRLMFGRIYLLPFEVSGTGSGSFQASGPFALTKMDYKVQSNFYRGSIAGETFDHLVFDLHANAGQVVQDTIRFTKSSGTVEVQGQITPEGVIDTVAVARGLRLEQSENTLALGLDVQGIADFSVLVRGQLPKPRIEINGRFSRMLMAEAPVDDSIFKLNFLSDRVEASGQFLGNVIRAGIIYPYTDEGPFEFKFESKNWDFTGLFSMVAKSARQLDFSTSLTSTVDLKSSSGGFWSSSGAVKIQNFELKKSSKIMKTSGPVEVTMKNGVINSNNLGIASNDGFIKVDIVESTKNSLNTSINGKLDLSMMGLLTPFITDLRGNLAISMDIAGPALSPKLSGSAYIEKGYAKFAEFIHPFSDVKADILFNDNQLLVNTLRADLAGGKISGEGRIAFSRTAATVNADGRFSDVSINVPEDYRTHGSGTVQIQGSGFPYTMRIQYGVDGGEIRSEFGESTGGVSSVKASAYLPKFLYKENFHPFSFDVDVLLKNPVLVTNSLVNTQVSGQVRAIGVPDRLQLKGTLTPLTGGKFFFKDTPFEINTAYVEYNNDPPERPRVYLSATTRVSENIQDDQGRATANQYDVNLLVQGRGPKPQISLSSQPPLSQREIVSLLALGMTTANLDEGQNVSAQTANSATSAAVGDALLKRTGGRKLKESLGVDVKVSSTQSTAEDASTPKVTLSKQWTPKLGASASSTLQANPTNTVKIEYKFNKGLSVIGSWDGREYVPEQKDATQNVFGLDLEYKVQFK